jgi:hypothetical protein
MDKVQKILASAPKLKRDSLIPSSAPREVVAATAAQPRKPEHQKKATIFPRKLQIPVTVEQEMVLDQIAKRLQGNRKGMGGESINSNTVARCLIQLLEGIQIAEDDVALSEAEVFSLLKKKIGIK